MERAWGLASPGLLHGTGGMTGQRARKKDCFLLAYINQAHISSIIVHLYDIVRYCLTFTRWQAGDTRRPSSGMGLDVLYAFRKQINVILCPSEKLIAARTENATPLAGSVIVV